jgi:hypothetical protein
MESKKNISNGKMKTSKDHVWDPANSENGTGRVISRNPPLPADKQIAQLPRLPVGYLLATPKNLGKENLLITVVPRHWVTSENCFGMV